MSDDAHGIDQVGLNYTRVVETVREAKLDTIYYCSPSADDPTHFNSVDVADIEELMLATT